MAEKRNHFEAPKRKGPDGRRPDLRERCGVFKMTAMDEKDEIFLSHLYRCIWVTGGSITIKTPDGTETYRCGE